MKKMMFNDRYGLTEAVIEKRQTVTRRIMNPQPSRCDVCKPDNSGRCIDMDCQDYPVPITKKPPYKVGEIVAVAQRYSSLVPYSSDRYYPELMEAINEAHCLCCEHTGHLDTVAGWANKMFVYADLMPHQIRILDVRAERLRDITEEDCLREGICKATMGYYIQGLIANWEKESHTEHEDGRCYKLFPTPKEAFASLIDKISGRGTWATNPYVWRIEFELVGTNEK